MSLLKDYGTHFSPAYEAENSTVSAGIEMTSYPGEKASC
jgi:hypothetical protein